MAAFASPSLPMDVSTVEGCLALAAAYARHEAKLDILVNNAGAAWGAAFDENVAWT